MIINPSMSNIAPVQTASTPAVSAPVVQEQSKQPESLGDSVSITIPAEIQKKSSSKKASKAHSVKAEAPQVKSETKTEAKAEAKTTETAAPARSSAPSSIALLDEGGLNAFKTSQAGDTYNLNDGFDESRDIVSVSANEGKPTEPYTFKITMKELKEGVQNGHLDAYLLLNLRVPGSNGKLNLPDEIPGSTSSPWNVALCGYDEKNFSILDENGNVDKGFLKDLKFNTETSSVEFSLDKELLRQKGWKDGDPIQLQPFTAKDFVKQVTDSIDAPGNKSWDSGKLNAFADTLKDHTLADGTRPVDSWRNDIIYFVMTDRFADGDKTNNDHVDTSNAKRYHGGDIQGIIDNLDYIKDTGATAIWLTPVMKNQTEFFDSDGYHGYWPIDFFQTDEHVGSMEKFTELINKAHDKKMKIVLDIPLNHTAWEHPFYKDPEKKETWYHNIGDIQDFDDPYQAENGSMFGLPDLAQENPEVSKYLIDVSKFWIDKGIDGFRLDAVKNVPVSFWNEFSHEIHQYAGQDFYLVGECFDGDPAKLNKFQGADMDALFDYPLHFTMKNVFAHDGSMRELANKMAECDAKYEHPEMMSAFLDNHDTVRFLTEAGGDKNKMKLALGFQMTINRIPSVYYGTEQAMDGGCDIMGEIHNRDDMEFGKDPDMLAYFKQLTTIRQENPALRTGDMKEMWQDDKVLAYSRSCPEQEAIVILNNNYNPEYREIPLRAESGIKDGTVMMDKMTGKTVTVQNGKICATIDPKRPGIFVPVK